MKKVQFNSNLINDEMNEIDELLDAINEELDNNNVVVFDSEEEEESVIETVFDDMQINTMK